MGVEECVDGGGGGVEGCAGAVDEGGADGTALGAEGGVIVSVRDLGGSEDGGGGDFDAAGLGLQVEGCRGGGGVVGGVEEGEVDVDAAG